MESLQRFVFFKNQFLPRGAGEDSEHSFASSSTSLVEWLRNEACFKKRQEGGAETQGPCKKESGSLLGPLPLPSQSPPPPSNLSLQHLYLWILEGGGGMGLVDSLS